MCLVDLIDTKFFNYRTQEEFKQLELCLAALNYGDLDVLCCNDIQGERKIQDVSTRGIFY